MSYKMLEGVVSDIVEQVLKDLITEIDNTSYQKNFVVKSLETPAQRGRFYYRGTLNGIDIAKKIIDKKLKEIRDGNRKDFR